MSFTATTVRRVLYEGGPSRFLYAIGNTQARPVLPAGQGPWAAPSRVRPAAAAGPAACMLLSEAAQDSRAPPCAGMSPTVPAPCPQVLLLGCGDIRNALVTAASLRQLLLGAAPDRATSENDNKEEIQIHLNDVSDCIMARDVLLLVRPAPAQQPPCAINTWMRPAVAQHMALLRSLRGRSLPPPILTLLRLCWWCCLQAIASSIDPSSVDDLQYLWAVWFNATLSQQHSERLQTLLRQV